MTLTRTANPQLLALFGIALLVFGLVILNRCLASDSLACDESTCVIERKVPVPFGSLQAFRRTARPQDIEKLESMTYEAKSGDTEYLVTYRSGAERETVNLRLRLDARGEGEARRFFAEPRGRLALEGPRRTRDYPFAAMLLGLATAAFLAAYKEWRKTNAVA